MRKNMKNENYLFWDVDTQNDFMKKDGLLYVPESESIIPIIKEITDFAIKNKILLKGSIDWHNEKSKEFIKNGGQFPEHCIAHTNGCKKIAYEDAQMMFSKSEHIAFLKLGKNTIQELILKDTIDVFDVKGMISNKNLMQKIAMENNKKTIVIFGVATEYCVKKASIGWKKYGCKVIVIEDAIKGVSEKETNEAIDEMKQIGIEFMKWNEFTNLYGD
jgi:nicotinamidase/pyrazinamidase